MARIRLETKVGTKKLTLDLPNGLHGNPAVINVTNDDGSRHGPEYVDRDQALARVVALLTLAVVLFVMGCGGESTMPATGSGGAASSAVTGSASAGGSGGQGGSAPVEVKIGNFDCAAFETSIGPLNGELTDGMGQPIHEDGAIAMLRVTPPAYPWTATALTYGLAVGGFCAITDHEVIAFAGPAGEAPPTHPAGATVTPVAKSDVTAQASGATVTTALAAPVTVKAGQVLWIGVRLHVVAGGGGKRACAYACDDGLDHDSWFSAVGADAAVSPCPEDACALKELSQSPSDAEAVKLHNNVRRWPFVVTGHE